MPETPSASDARRVLAGLMPRLRECAGAEVGMANAIVVVRGDGSVDSVAVGGSPFGSTPQGSCMEAVIRDARFPPFQRSTFPISYPIVIRPTLNPF